MCLVDGSQAPVGVVVGARARTEWTHWTRMENVVSTNAKPPSSCPGSRLESCFLLTGWF